MKTDLKSVLFQDFLNKKKIFLWAIDCQILKYIYLGKSQDGMASLLAHEL